MRVEVTFYAESLSEIKLLGPCPGSAPFVASRVPGEETKERAGLCTAASPALLNFAVDAKGKVKGAGETPAVRKEL